MRNQASWQERALPKIKRELSPRIQKDLETIPLPNKLPALDSYFIYGPIKSGKTMQSVFFYLKACEQRFLNATTDDIRFIKMSTFLTEVKRTFGDPTLSEYDYVQGLIDCDFLVLDDFGMEKASEWLLSLLYLLIDSRYENMKTTIITSNFELGEIATNLGDSRITSRIERMCKLIHKTKY